MKNNMPLWRKPTKQQLLALEGLTLLHFGLSNCSQRVRICLIEKKLDWRSLSLNMMMNEHATPWYQSINAKGVIPTLIHDGRIITESNDIIQYLDRLSEGVSLTPCGEERQSALRQWLVAADALQGAIKLLSHVFLFGIQRPLAKWFMPRFERNHHNQELVEFRRRFVDRTFTEEEIGAAVELSLGALKQLNEAIGQNSDHCDWLQGDCFGLADIAWVVNVHRLELIGFQLERFPNVQQWYRRCLKRPSVKQGLLDYEPKLIRWMLKINSGNKTEMLKRYAN